MNRFVFALMGLTAAVGAQTGGSRAAPQYTVESFFNSASFEARFAPGMLIGVTGKNLAWAERWRQDVDLQGDTLPTTLPETWVTVTVNSIPAAIEYASPDQVLFLMPPGIKPGPVSVRLSVAGVAGPKATLQLKETAPGLYRYQENLAMVRRQETMEFVTTEAPAQPGEEVILYANGLGATAPAQKIRVMPRDQAELKQRDSLRILLNDNEIASELVSYAGIMPGYPAFYEIRLKLPDEMPPNPELKVCLGEDAVRAGCCCGPRLRRRSPRQCNQKTIRRVH